MEKIIYLDNNATTRVHKEVIEAMLPYFDKYYANPSGMYTFAKETYKKMEEAREQVADFLGAESMEICFTSCGSEGDNLAVRGTLEAYPNKKHIITSRVEHPAITATYKDLERKGYKTTFLDVNDKGELDLTQLENAITEDTAIVSLMWANNETGVIFNVEQAAEIVKKKGSIMHVDAVQAAGKIPINMKNNKIDLMTISGHKIHAPKGIGALYIRKGTMIRAVQTGGHHERNRRAGTENLPYIIGLGVAASMAKRNILHDIDHTKLLRDTLESELTSKIKNTKVNGKGAERLPNTLNISFEYIEGEAILLMLDRYGICASTGSACSSGTLEPSPILRAMNIPFELAHSATRFSFSVYNTMEEVHYTVNAVVKTVDTLRRISPYTPKDFWK